MIEHEMRKIPNTFGLDVEAAVFLEYSSVEELEKLIAAGRITSPYLHIGGGSNLLFTGNYEGVILHSRIGGIEVTAEDEEKASAVQNIGAYGVEVKDLISFVETVNIQGVKHVYQTDECDYSYRSSVFKRPEMKQVFVTYVGFSLSKKESYTLDYGTIRQELEKYPKVDLKTLRQVIIDIRESKLPDPKVLGNAGSFFMNPVVAREVFEALREQYPQMPFYEISADRIKIPAGWMIDQCGWKGKSLGPAAVHDKQALVLVNRGGATGADIVALSDAVRASVRDKFGIDIHPEVNFI